MRYLSRFWWLATLAIAFISNGCGGRTVNKNSARDVIIGSPAAVLAKTDVEVVSVTSVGSHEAVVETRLNVAFRMERSGSDWIVREVRVGHGQWEKVDDVLQALRQIKSEQTRELLGKVAAAIETYKQKNGRLPEFKDFVSLTDVLYPVYLSPLIREDAWRHPLVAISARPGTIRLISAGPDGKLGTPDDIELTRTFSPL